MTTITEAPVASDDLWNSLFSNQPDSRRLHHCWVEQCPPGSDDEGDGEWDDNEPLPPGYPDWHCILCGDSGMNGDPHHCDGCGDGS